MSAGGSAWVVSGSPLTIPPQDADSTIILETLQYDGTGTIVFNSKTYNMLTNGHFHDFVCDKGFKVVITFATGFGFVRWRYEKLGN
jgi:hypothetical protein